VHFIALLFISFQTHSPPGFVSQSRSKIQHHHHHLLLLLLTLLHKQSIHEHFLLFFNSVQKLTQSLYLDLSSIHHHHQYLLLHNFLLLRLSIHEHFLLFFISLQKLARSLAHSPPELIPRPRSKILNTSSLSSSYSFSSPSSCS
jgi:hypothetical protein